MRHPPHPENSGEEPEGLDPTSAQGRKLEEHRRQTKKATQQSLEKKNRRRPPSECEFLETPSLRWEFSGWKIKSQPSWTARDLVGYWAHRYLEKTGNEDRDLFVTGVNAPQTVKLFRNVKLCVQRFFDSDCRRAAAAVDQIFERAPRDKWALRYYFTPSNASTLRSLDQLKTHFGYRGRTAPHVKDDARGSDLAYWDRKRKAALAFWSDANPEPKETWK